MADLCDLACAAAKLTLAPAIGGAIVALRYRDADVLRPSDPAAVAAADVRGLACYPLVPYSNRIAQARLRFGAATYTLAHNFGDHPHAIHGVGWQQPWTVEAHAADRARLALVHHAETPAARAAWPWPFAATQSFRLSIADDASRAGADPVVVLEASLAIRSLATEPFPFGLGWHPYFPCDAGTRIGFRAGSVWRNDATQLPIARVPIPAEWRFDPPRTLGETVLDQVFDDWGGVATLEQPARAHAVALEADRACAHLVVYAPAGRGFVALEPVTHETDAFNRAAAGARGTGTRLIAPGQAFSCTMRLTMRPAAAPS